MIKEKLFIAEGFTECSLIIMQQAFVGQFILLFKEIFVCVSWMWSQLIYMVIWIKTSIWMYLKDLAVLYNLENFAICWSSYASHSIGLNKQSYVVSITSQCLLSHGFKNDDICPCICIKHHLREFFIMLSMFMTSISLEYPILLKMALPHLTASSKWKTSVQLHSTWDFRSSTYQMESFSIKSPSPIKKWNDSLWTHLILLLLPW